jgi:ubiquinone/menaquinone biosynthesis C-methylase UbiE
MKAKHQSHNQDILSVSRSKEQARHYYDRVSKIYDSLIGVFERKYAGMALKSLSVKASETVLEIGFGTGRCLQQIAESVGKTGKAYGVDISPGMLKITRKRLVRAKLTDRVNLYCGDAMKLPYDDNIFDAVFMSFTLELIDTPEILPQLEEIKRVLKPGGRIAVAGMSKENGQPMLLKLYEWAHKTWPVYVDCRPVYISVILLDAGFKLQKKDNVKLFGFPCEIVIAVKESHV